MARRISPREDTARHEKERRHRAEHYGADGPFVYVVGSDRLAKVRLVDTDVENDGITVISKGLASGEQVVLEGHVRLKDGMPVRLQEDRRITSAGGAE